MVYANLAVIVGPRGVGAARLPLPAVLRDSFDLFGMFRYYDTVNKELLVWGLPESPRTQPGEPVRWIRLGARAFFPGSPSHRLTRAWCAHHLALFGQEGQTGAWRRMARQIRERHNREHPEYRVSRVWLQTQVWPKSIEGRDRGKVRERLQVESWYREE